MSALRELQRDFASAIFCGDAHSQRLLARCSGNADRSARGLDAYRSSVISNLAGAVQATYPVLESIVGKDFLTAAARRYATERPSGSGDLNAYGSDFDDYLAHYEPAGSLPYLPDVARLEWLVQRVYGAEDAPPQDLSLLADTAPANWAALRFRLDPAHACLASEWPIVRIWEVNQAFYDGDFLVDFGQSETALVHRRPEGIAVETLNPGELDLLLALGTGNTFGTAVEAATRAEEFDLQAAMRRFIANGLFRQAY